ncbi:MAG: hypothetical protein DMG49_02480 [Acidobacteria bacterium]|nr:MAG: hypothetical protein DMG49_02480 [Acidobacteriota bacterium]
MGSYLATIVCALGILGLFALDWDRRSRTSLALWIPVVWLLLGASRMASLAAVFGVTIVEASSAQEMLKGSPFERLVFSSLVALSLIVLARRGWKAGRLLSANPAIVLFLLYCGASILWADYPDVTFKRWIKALGDLAMVLIVLTDEDPSAALKRLLARVGFVLIPASILLAKYYPALGLGWSAWGGATAYVRGVATSKNELGGICLLFGLGSVWRFCLALRDREETHRLRILTAHGIILTMVAWLFWRAHTATALGCFVMASTLAVTTNFQALTRRLWVLHAVVAAMISVSYVSLFLDVGSDLLESIGRDPTLTGRTELWNRVLAMTPNSFLGAGFESFWLPPRLNYLWSLYWWHPNEAHNGYIEVYINLGWIGIVLLALILLTGYRKVFGAVRQNPEEGGLWLGYFFAGLVYNFTESAVRIMHPVWIFFLLATIAASAVSVPKAVPALNIEQREDLSEWATPYREFDLGSHGETH